MGGIGYYMYFITQFKHKFRIRELVNGRTIIIDDKARNFKDKQGVEYWQLLKRNKKVQIPPSEAIEIDFRGKKCVEAYKTETGEFVYLKDNGSIDKAEADAMQPLTTKSRVILVNEIAKAHMKRTKKWEDYIIPIAGISALVVIVISLMIFYGDMAKPLITMGGQLNAHAEIQTHQLEILREIKNDVQTIREDGVMSPTKPPD